MIVHGLTVCVNYGDLLAQALPGWMVGQGGLASLTVVTSTTDEATRALCENFPGVRVFQTDSFYADGAAFNKGRAMSEAVAAGCLPLDEWVLLLDGDIVLPMGWLEHIEKRAPSRGTIYGARRVDERGNVLPDGIPAGYFLLFHGGDAGAAVRPMFDVKWAHAGNFDSTFVMRWPARRAWLPMSVTHLGEPGQNWFGRGNVAAMHAMRAERLRRGGWQHETIPVRDEE